MQTNQLPNEVLKLKTDLKKRVEQFNRETGLNVSGVLIEAEFTQEKMGNQPVVKNYDVGVNIAL